MLEGFGSPRAGQFPAPTSKGVTFPLFSVRLFGGFVLTAKVSVRLVLRICFAVRLFSDAAGAHMTPMLI